MKITRLSKRPILAREGKVRIKVSKIVLKFFALLTNLNNLPKRKILNKEALLPIPPYIPIILKSIDDKLIIIKEKSKTFQESLKYLHPIQLSFRTASIINTNMII